MRFVLDTLYRLTELLGAVFFVAIGVPILLQVFARPLGVMIPAADEFAGYFMAASVFLMLGPAFRRGAHIRVGILVDRLTGRPRRGLELACLLLAAALTAYFAFYWVRMTLVSHEFGDVSQGVLPIRLWVPQAGMAAGLCVLVVALFDDLVAVALGRPPSYDTAAPAGEG